MQGTSRIFPALNLSLGRETSPATFLMIVQDLLLRSQLILYGHVRIALPASVYNLSIRAPRQEEPVFKSIPNILIKVSIAVMKTA